MAGQWRRSLRNTALRSAYGLRGKSYEMLSYWVVLVSPPDLFALSATHSAAARRKIAVFLGGRLANLVQPPAQLKDFRPVGHVADKPPAGIDTRLCHQCLKLAQLLCIVLRLLRKLLTTVEHVSFRLGEKAASRLGGAPAQGHSRQGDDQDGKSAVAHVPSYAEHHASDIGEFQAQYHRPRPYQPPAMSNSMMTMISSVVLSILTSLTV
jgi:hypothetical protein